MEVEVVRCCVLNVDRYIYGKAKTNTKKEGYKSEGEYTKPHPSLATSFHSRVKM